MKYFTILITGIVLALMLALILFGEKKYREVVHQNKEYSNQIQSQRILILKLQESHRTYWDSINNFKP